MVTLATELYPTADLDVTTGVSPKKPREGEPAAFKTVIRNDGPDAAPAVVVTDRVAGPAEILSARPSQGTCVVGDHTVRCELGTISAGGTATVRVRVRPDELGTLVNRVGVTSGATDPTPVGELPALRARVAEGRGVLHLRKRERALRPSRPGGGLQDHAALDRGGQRPAPARCDRPPGGLVLISARGTRIRNGRACWSIRALAPGARRVLRLNARVVATAATGLRNTARVEARNAATRSAAAPLRVGPVRQGPCAASAARAC